VSQRIGRATNNVAEYRAAIAGLEAALALTVRRVELRMDSELVVRQVEGRYRVRNPALRKLFARLVELRSRFDSFQARAIPRSENRSADGLANAALDGP
jgi:probable phosphoglycerate mutase